MDPYYYFQVETIGPNDIFSFVTFIYTMLLVLAHVGTVLVSHSPFACLYCKGGRFPNGLEMASERSDVLEVKASPVA